MKPQKWEDHEMLGSMRRSPKTEPSWKKPTTREMMAQTGLRENQPRARRKPSMP